MSNTTLLLDMILGVCVFLFFIFLHDLGSRYTNTVGHRTLLLHVLVARLFSLSLLSIPDKIAGWHLAESFLFGLVLVDMEQRNKAFLLPPSIETDAH